MDLLGGYGSNDDGSDSDSSNSATSEVKSKNSIGPELPPPARINNNGAALINRGNGGNNDKKQVPARRGKKLLSLHAVLPQHILDQLTKNTNQDTDDEDDDDDYDGGDSRQQQQQEKKQSSNKIVDKNISMLLSELNSAKASTSSKNNIITNSNNNKNSSVSTIESMSNSISAALGAAFITTETTVVKRRQPNNIDDGNNEVEDIHSSKPIRADFPTASASSDVARPRVSAAPPVASAPTTRNTNTSKKSKNEMQSKPAPMPPPPREQQLYQEEVALSGTTQHQTTTELRASRKRSRREVERALRAGNMTAVDDTDATATTTIEAVDPNAYVPQEETYSLPSHGVKVVPVQMYNPKEGTDVLITGSGGTDNFAGGKQRNKHQINHLMASAATLELQRARGDVGGGAAGKTKKSSYRADAKRKYGW